MLVGNFPLKISRRSHHHHPLDSSVQFLSPGFHWLLSPRTRHNYTGQTKTTGVFVRWWFTEKLSGINWASDHLLHLSIGRSLQGGLDINRTGLKLLDFLLLILILPTAVVCQGLSLCFGKTCKKGSTRIRCKCELCNMNAFIQHIETHPGKKHYMWIDINTFILKSLFQQD